MKHRKIGQLEVSAVGLGCMGMSHGYGAPADKAEMTDLQPVSRSNSFQSKSSRTVWYGFATDSIKTTNFIIDSYALPRYGVDRMLTQILNSQTICRQF